MTHKSTSQRSAVSKKRSSNCNIESRTTNGSEGQILQDQGEVVVTPPASGLEEFDWNTALAQLEMDYKRMTTEQFLATYPWIVSC